MTRSLDYHIVARARGIIADPRHWMQGELAVDKDDRSVEPIDPRANRFCAVAAIRRAVHEFAPGHDDLAIGVQTTLEQFVHLRYPHLEDDLESLNDESNHATVLQVLDDFIAASVSAGRAHP